MWYCNYMYMYVYIYLGSIGVRVMVFNACTFNNISDIFMMAVSNFALLTDCDLVWETAFWSKSILVKFKILVKIPKACKYQVKLVLYCTLIPRQSVLRLNCSFSNQIAYRFIAITILCMYWKLIYDSNCAITARYFKYI